MAKPFRSFVASMESLKSASRASMSAIKSMSMGFALGSAEPGTTESYLAFTNLMTWKSAVSAEVLTLFTKLPKFANSSLLFAAMNLLHRKDESFVSGRCDRR